MVNEDLIKYIKSELDSQVSKEAITKSLLTQGWDQEDIDTAYASIPAPTKEKKRVPLKILIVLTIIIAIIVFTVLGFLLFSPSS